MEYPQFSVDYFKRAIKEGTFDLSDFLDHGFTILDYLFTEANQPAIMKNYPDLVELQSLLEIKTQTQGASIHGSRFLIGVIINYLLDQVNEQNFKIIIDKLRTFLKNY